MTPIPSRERDEQLREHQFRVNRVLQSLGQITDVPSRTEKLNVVQNLAEET